MYNEAKLQFVTPNIHVFKIKILFVVEKFVLSGS